MEQVDAMVIGAGVVGLAVGRALAMRGLGTVVLEAEAAVGMGVSSRNSEVIHAGLYYPSGSLKAEACVSGRERLYGFCESRGVAHRRCGKLVVATDAFQMQAFERLLAQASANGVHDLQRLTAHQAQALEPQLACVAAALSPSTGIVDSHGLMLALQGDLEAAGGVVALRSPVLGVDLGAQSHLVEVGGDEPMTLSTSLLVNAAGLGAVRVASLMRGLDPALLPRARLCKGNYFSLTGRAPFSHLVYPLPQAAGLGVHLTLDLGEQARFGPDVEWLPDPEGDGPLDYRVEASRGEAFYAEVRRYWPGLPDAALVPAYSGIRPKIHGPDEPAPDFMLQAPAVHQVRGLVNLFGIESPGLTSCLALAEEVLVRLGVSSA